MKVGIVYKKDNRNISFLRSSPAERGAGLKDENGKAREFGQKAIDYLKKKGEEVVKMPSFATSDAKALEVKKASEGKTDFIVTFGGDGTLIHTACEYASQGVPLVGINTGNLGFLTAAESKDWQEAVENLIQGKYFVSERISLEAVIEQTEAHLRGVPGNSKAYLGGGIFRAVNEVVVKGLYRVIDVAIKVSGVKFLKVLGDGVIISTQTGSTAYSLSAGGPIVDANLDSLLITPLNPIGLPIPSIVLSPDDEIEITLNKGDDVSLVLDGQEHEKISQSQSVKVKRGEHKIKFVYFDKHHFIKSLNAKFGLSSRSVG